MGATTVDSHRLRLAQLALLAGAVGFAYYVGVQIGIGLTFPPATTTSVLWPPNAILTAALLLVPVRYWWVCLAGALPVHMVLELAAGFERYVAGFLFVTNCMEAMVAAGAMRVLSDSPTEFNSLRRVAVFLGMAVIAAPIVSSFADAAVVNVIQGLPYWDVWRVRTFANALTELSVVPVVVLGVRAVRRGKIEWPSRRRLIEASLLVAGLLWAPVAVFGGNLTFPGIPPTPSVLLLPFYFWAAVRFGVGSVSGALFVTALVASYEAQLGHRPFEVLPAAEGLIALQMYLLIMGMPLTALAGLLSERRRAEAALQERLRFEGTLTRISAAFVRQPLAVAFPEGLRDVGQFFHADYVALLQVGEDNSVHVGWQWHHPSGAALVDRDFGGAFPGIFSRVLAGETVIVGAIDALPADPGADRNAFRDCGLLSAAAVPLLMAGRVQGALWLATLRQPTRPNWHLGRLSLVAEVLANAFARAQAQWELARDREKLAFMARVSSMGELTASLAHQLNQPLTAVRNNAEAALQLIERNNASRCVLQEILADIIADDQRATDVIRRVRDMLRRQEWSPQLLDANTLVREVAAVLASDTVLRNVTLSLDFASEPVALHGNRIDLEQVLLNVVMNAMEAVADRPVPQRIVLIQTRRLDHTVYVIVRDRGVGFTTSLEDTIFEPFVTTKGTGMGMGLAVARSLIHNHGGSIHASNDPDGGAIVTIALPALAVAQ